MPNQNLFKITENTPLNKNVFKLTVKGNTDKIKNAGQFCNLQIHEKFLRRPLSVFDYDDNYIKFVYKTVGSGTEILSTLTQGQHIDILTGLGNGFDASKAYGEIELIGGGIGIPPLYALAKQLIKIGKQPKVLLGFNCGDEIILKEDFESLGLKVSIFTVDGSCHNGGLVTNGMSQNPYVFTCGPMPMLKAVYDKAKDGQFSFEARMGCGFGACMGCSVNTKNGIKRICKEGPVLYKNEIMWE